TNYTKLPDWKPTDPDGDLRENSLKDRGLSAFLNLKYKKITFNSIFITSKYNTHTPTHPLVPEKLTLKTQTKRGFIDLGYRHSLSDEWEMSFNLTDTYFMVTTLVDRFSNDFVAEWTNFIKPSDKLNIVTGALLNHFQGEEYFLGAEGDWRLLSIPREKKLWWGFYGQLDYQIIEDVKGIAGFQANKIENVSIDFVPRLGLIWKPTAKIGIKLLYGQAFRGPSLLENNINDPLIIGNPDLKPEKVDTFDLELIYRSEKIQSSLAFFYSKQKSLIARDLVSLPPFSHVNEGTLKIKGAEFESKYFLSKDWFLSGALAYQTNKLNNTYTDSTPIPNLSAKMGVSYQSDKGITIGLFDIYNGKPEDVSVINPNRRLTNPVPDAYHLLNLNIDVDLYKLLQKSRNVSTFSLFYRIENLLDEDIYIPEWVARATNSIPGRRGRSVYGGVKATF
ncbi:TonB-dependent receptor plug domain-containing protein, partial [Candidatus Auribacterota bacterium]